MPWRGTRYHGFQRTVGDKENGTTRALSEATESLISFCRRLSFMTPRTCSVHTYISVSELAPSNLATFQQSSRM